MRQCLPILLCVLSAYSCRISRVGKDYPDSQSPYEGADASSHAPIIQPQRQAELGAVFKLSLDGSGKVLEKIGLRLDYFPAPRADGVSVPTCYEKISESLVVGRLSCVGNANLAMDITVSQVFQQCYTSSPMRKIAPTGAMALTGCIGAANLQAFRFSPDIKLEIIK